MYGDGKMLPPAFRVTSHVLKSNERGRGVDRDGECVGAGAARQARVVAKESE